MGASISYVSRKCSDKWTIAAEIQISPINKLTDGQFSAFFPQVTGTRGTISRIIGNTFMISLREKIDSEILSFVQSYKG